MTDLCREFNISRKTGNKFRERFERLGETGLHDLSRAPRRTPSKTPAAILAAILDERRAHPTWGARKIKAVLQTRGIETPGHGAIERALAKAGLVSQRRRRRRFAAPPPDTLRAVKAPNEVWCIDYKGQFRLGDQSLCYPLTVTDQYCRFILGCEATAAICDEEAREICHDIFGQFGLPRVIRSDNGAPFASTGLAGLTKLSAYFLRLGIALERIRPAHPQDNGRHERMHRTLKAETTRPARANLLQQQERFDAWVREFNYERPHEALAMKRPADLYVASARVLPPSLPELTYPFHDDTVRVSPWGDIRIAGLGTVRLTRALAGHPVGVREEPDGRWRVSFATLDLGFAKGGAPLDPIL